MDMTAKTRPSAGLDFLSDSITMNIQVSKANFVVKGDFCVGGEIFDQR